MFFVFRFTRTFRLKTFVSKADSGLQTTTTPDDSVSERLRLWMTTDDSGRLRAIPGNINSGRLWTTRDDSGRLWRTLEDSGRLWMTLDNSGGLWRILEDSGRLPPGVSGECWVDVLFRVDSEGKRRAGCSKRKKRMCV